MQYQQGPPQQVIVKKKENRGCLAAWYAPICLDIAFLVPLDAVCSSPFRVMHPIGIAGYLVMFDLALCPWRFIKWVNG